MKIPLKSLFCLTLICALFAFWLGRRQTVMFPPALVQVVAISPGPKSGMPSTTELESLFYRQLRENISISKTPGIEELSDAEIRRHIHLDAQDEGSDSVVFVINAIGNPLRTDRERLKRIYKIAIETAADGIDGAGNTKLLTMPKL